MKKSPKNIEYFIEEVKWKDSNSKTAKECIEEERIWALKHRFEGDDSWRSWQLVTKEEVKLRLSPKQYSDWRQGNKNSFITKEFSKK